MISCYRDWITENYEIIKDKFSKSYYKSTGNVLSEDIFHDTLIKCVNPLGEYTKRDTKVIENYLYISFKNNMLRDKLYARNKTKQLDASTVEIPDIDKSEYWADRDKIEEWVNKKYGPEIFECLASWLLDGKSVKELKEEHPNLTGIRYKLDKIIDYISNNYDKQILYDINNY